MLRLNLSLIRTSEYVSYVLNSGRDFLLATREAWKDLKNQETRAEN